MRNRFVLYNGKDKIKERFEGLTDVCSFEKDRQGNIHLCWAGKNASPKAIHYFRITIYFLTADECAVTDVKVSRQTRIGPILPQEEMVIYSNVGRFADCRFVVIGEIETVFADRTEEKTYIGQVAKEGSALSEWDGTAAEKTEN